LSKGKLLSSAGFQLRYMAAAKISLTGVRQDKKAGAFPESPIGCNQS
jgi:hypothetical protein